MEFKHFPQKFYRYANKTKYAERPIFEDIYPEIDNDLARDNLENDITAADILDL